MDFSYNLPGVPNAKPGKKKHPCPVFPGVKLAPVSSEVVLLHPGLLAP